MGYVSNALEEIKACHYVRRNHNPLHVDSDGRVTTLAGGITSSRKFRVINRVDTANGTKILIKATGFSGWIGRGAQGYYPPQYLVGEISPSGKMTVIYEVEYPRSHTRKAKVLAETLLENLVRGQEPAINEAGEFL